MNINALHVRDSGVPTQNSFLKIIMITVNGMQSTSSAGLSSKKNPFEEKPKNLVSIVPY